MLKVAIEYDDAGWTHPIGVEMFNHFHEIRQHYPNYKATLFTIPWEMRFGNTESLAHPHAKKWVDACKKANEEGWLYFALHGLTHLGPTMKDPGVAPEFSNLTYESAAKRVKAGKDIFELIGLPLLPIFKAPNWALGTEARKAVEDAGFQVVDDRYYQWNLRDLPPKEGEFKGMVIGHGHIQDGDGCFNGLSETKKNIYELPSDTEFYPLNEAI